MFKKVIICRRSELEIPKKKLNFPHTKQNNGFVLVRFASIKWLDHRLSINRTTKRGKEKSSSDGHYQCEKEMDDHLLACQQILEIEPHSDTNC
jgi:hypothetical protein